MKRILLVVPLLVAFCLLATQGQEAPDAKRPPPPIDVYFSPKGGCTEAVVREIGNAKSSILVQVYSFTSAPIAKALVGAHKRGVKIEVILDKSQRTEKYSEADFLVNFGIPTRIDAQHAIAHNKLMVIDGEVVVTGSFNFTKAAEESNAENLLVIRDNGLAERYTANWQKHAGHSELYGGRADRPAVGTPKEVGPASDASQTGDGGFVASKKSEVFHRPGCKSAARISPKNVVRYATREQAVQAGKRPCGECKP